MTVHGIDVGRGAATLLELPSAAVLIDTGGETAGGFNAAGRLL
jgi:beta-lactamase superfamily II metal-dependent hydrolase